MKRGGLQDPNRLDVLRRLGILDTPAEPAYDDLARLAGLCCRAPIAAVNFVDDHRHWTKAKIGDTEGPGGSVPADVSFCAATVSRQSGLLVVADTTKHEGWRDHPLVVGPPYIRFYAGAAIVVEGEPVGVVCVFAHEPLEVGEVEEQALVALAAQAAAQLELRNRNVERGRLITELAEVIADNRTLIDRFEGAFEHAPSGMALVGVDRLIMRANGALGRLLGMAPGALAGTSLQAITDPGDVENDLDRFAELERGAIDRYAIELRLVHADGGTLWVGSSWSAVRDAGGNVVHYVAQVKDISERKLLEASLRRLADQDALTGVRSRRLFEEDLATQVGRCRRYGEQAALLVIDLNDFKQINDRHGHQAGDEMLCAVAATLKRRLRTSDLVARTGGDEFAVLLPHMPPSNLDAVLATLRAGIADTVVDIAGGLSVTASIGAACLDEHSRKPESALAEADRAMYEDKRARKASSPAA